MVRSYRSIPLNPLRTFAIAARHRTFTSAARHMNVSQVAISRQITTLEDYLGVKLFDRNARSVALTDQGRNFAREIGTLFDDIEKATERVRYKEQANVINLRIYPTLAHYWLLPKLGDFSRRHPNYQIRFDTVVEPLDFRGTHLDVAIQLGNQTWRETRSRKLFDEVIDVVCSPDYAARFDDFADPARLDDAQLLHARYRFQEWSVWAAEAGYTIRDNEGMVFDSSLLVYSAARQGVGLALGQIGLLDSELRSRTLVRPFMKPVETGTAFHAVWPTMNSVSLQTRHFIDWLLEISGEPPEFFKRPRAEQPDKASGSVPAG